MYKIFLFLLIIINLYSFENLEAEKIYKASGTVQSIVIKDDRLYAATSNGTVEIFNIENNNKIKIIKIPDIIDFIGDKIPAKIYSIDIFENKLLIVSQGLKGYRNIYLYENEKLNKIIGINSKYFIQKVNFISNEKLVFALLSNQVGVYNYKLKKLDYLIQVSSSSFSHFMINEEKTKIATTDESGQVRLLNLLSGQIEKELEAVNLDRIYQLDFKKNVILTAGQDRKAVLFKEYSNYSFSFDFLLYSCALSEDATLGAIAHNEQNDVLIFDTKTKNKLYNLVNQKGIVTQILFKNKNEVFISSDDSQINYFKLK